MAGISQAGAIVFGGEVLDVLAFVAGNIFGWNTISSGSKDYSIFVDAGRESMIYFAEEGEGEVVSAGRVGSGEGDLVG